ncbi:hypothetical protein [Rhizobium favelukesii]|uniref:hypothetical protein n=1 Tax=Rhizobium favelukesii TaxID=348824 RepID=UPI002160EC0B|nr:hypothetical protein [Rhizobium favelukesii]MCS0463179.1 hypothetical protein [Rhizobium favelukesii]
MAGISSILCRYQNFETTAQKNGEAARKLPFAVRPPTVCKVGVKLGQFPILDWFDTITETNGGGVRSGKGAPIQKCLAADAFFRLQVLGET